MLSVIMNQTSCWLADTVPDIDGLGLGTGGTEESCCWVGLASRIAV